jgi:hypothetical protein
LHRRVPADLDEDEDEKVTLYAYRVCIQPYKTEGHLVDCVDENVVLNSCHARLGLPSKIVTIESIKCPSII